MPDDNDLMSTRTGPGGLAPLPEQIGPFRLLQKLGEGGMGEVWEAEQTEPVRRRVALKVIKPGMDSRQVLARFEAERQALALMDHPNVAHVYEAGATPEGRPFFAMELVQGVPITEHCDRQKLTMQERMTLFLQVCEGVQHAHQNAIIHRDLKPTNILVAVQDGKPVPKIIDFGVAKATTQRLTEKTMFTELGAMIGTPEYMSPEQAEGTGQRVDTRTDVYSLGVLFYELLCGARPFDSKSLREAGFDELRRKIREDEPKRPSTRLSTLPPESSSDAARNRRTDPATLIRRLRGDLDWISMKALEKDRSRRYAAPSELAADIRRHLDNRPVLASPPGALYRARKFVRRHKVGVAFSTAAVVLLIGATLTFAFQARRIAEERDRANLEAETARQVSEFLEGIFEVSDPDESKGNEITARKLLDDGADRIRHELTDQPAVRARLMTTMGRVYLQLGLYEPAESLIDEGYEIRRRLFGDEDAQTIDSVYTRAWLTQRKGDLRTARSMLERALEFHESQDPIDERWVATILDDLGHVHHELGDLETALDALQRCLEIQERIHGPDTVKAAAALIKISDVQRGMARYDEARATLERAIDLYRRELGDDHLRVADAHASLGALLKQTGDLEGSLEKLEEALKIQERILGPGHDSVATTVQNLAVTLAALERNDEAKAAYERALAIQEKIHGPDHPNLAYPINSLAILASQAGRHREAISLYERTLKLFTNALGPEHPNIAAVLGNLALAHENQGDLNRARELHEESLAMREKLLGPDHPDLAFALQGLATVHRKLGDNKKALRLLERATEIRETALGTEHPDLTFNYGSIGRLYWEMGLGEKALPWLDRSIALAERAWGDESGHLAWELRVKGTVLRDLRRFDESLACNRRAGEMIRRLDGEAHVNYAWHLFDLGLLMGKMKRYDEMEDYFERGLAVMRNDDTDRRANIAEAHANLGEMLHDAERWDDARKQHSHALELRRELFGAEHEMVASSMDWIADLDCHREMWDRCLEGFRRAAGILAKTHGKGATPYGKMLTVQGWRLTKAGRLDEAFPRLEEALRIREEAFGEDDGRLGEDWINLGLAYLAKGERDRARRAFERAAALAEEDLGPGHKHVLWGLYNLACMAAVDGDREQALRNLHDTVERGFWDLKIASDPELESLHGDPDFEALVAEVKKRGQV